MSSIKILVDEKGFCIFESPVLMGIIEEGIKYTSCFFTKKQLSIKKINELKKAGSNRILECNDLLKHQYEYWLTGNEYGSYKTILGIN